MTDPSTTPEALARVLRDVDDCLRIEPIGDITVPVADLRVLRAAIARPDAPTPTPAETCRWCAMPGGQHDGAMHDAVAATGTPAYFAPTRTPAARAERDALLTLLRDEVPPYVDTESAIWGASKVLLLAREHAPTPAERVRETHAPDPSDGVPDSDGKGLPAGLCYVCQQPTDAPVHTPFVAVDLGVSGFGLSDDPPTPAGDDDRGALAQVIYEAHPWVDYNDVNGPVVPPRVVPWSEVKTLARIRFLEAADAVLTALAARPSAPTVTTAHQVTAEWGNHGGVSYWFRCNAPAESLCHAVYECVCEEWMDAGVTADGLPYHDVDSGDPDDHGEQPIRHWGQFEPDVCNEQDWFENSDEVLRGKVTFPVKGEWDGNGYTFEVAT